MLGVEYTKDMKFGSPRFETTVPPPAEDGDELEEGAVGAESSRPPVRSEAEARALKERLHFVAQVISGNSGLKLLPGEGWAASVSPEGLKEFKERKRKHPNAKPIPDILTYPEEHLMTRSEEYIWGVFRHEIGHFKHSDFGVVHDAYKQAMDEGYSQKAMYFLFNAWEDARSNYMEAKDSVSAAEKLAYYVREDYFSEEAKAKFAEAPAPVQFGFFGLMKGSRHIIPEIDLGELSALVTDEKVKDALATTDGALNRYSTDPDASHAFHDVMWTDVWPTYKELINKHVKEEREKRAKDMNMTEEELVELEKKIRDLLDKEFVKWIKLLMPKSAEVVEDDKGGIEIVYKEASEDDIKGGKEILRREEEERAEDKELEDVTREIEKEDLARQNEALEERRTGMTKEEQEIYKRFFDRVKPYIKLLQKELLEIFPPAEEDKWSRGHIRGKRISRHDLAREVAIGRGKMFMRRDVLEPSKAAFSLLIDVSGSMGGGAIDEALMAAILMAEALSSVGIPFEILSFHQNVNEIKGYGEKYDGAHKVKLLGVLGQVFAREAMYNNDGYAVDTAARRLQRQLVKEKADGALVVFSDGSPAESPGYGGAQWELKGIVEKWKKQVPLVGVGLGAGMDQIIKRYYGDNSAVALDITQLPKKLLEILSKQLKRFKMRKGKN